MLGAEKFDLFAMKDDVYAMTLMGTHGSLQVKDNQKESIRDVSNSEKKIKHKEVIANHFDYRGAVDVQNSERQNYCTKHELSLEET